MRSAGRSMYSNVRAIENQISSRREAAVLRVERGNDYATF